MQERLRGWLREQPDLTEDELSERLAGTGVHVSKSRVGPELRQMGERRKKPLHASERDTKVNHKSREEFLQATTHKKISMQKLFQIGRKFGARNHTELFQILRLYSISFSVNFP